MVSQCTKFEVSRFTRYDAMNSSSSFFNITLSTAKQHQSSGLKLYEVRSKAQYKPKMATMKQIKR